MRRQRIAVTVAVLVALAIAAAFALHDTDASHREAGPQYAREVTTILTRLAADVRRANARGGGVSASLRGMKAAIDRGAAQLALSSPPDRARNAHRALVEELRDYARQIDLVRASVDFGDAGTIASHLREITAPVLINRTLASLAALGYRIPVRIGVPTVPGGNG